MLQTDSGRRYIVLFQKQEQVRVRAALMELGIIINQELTLIGGFVCQLPQVQVQTVAQLDGVDWLGLDLPVKTMNRLFEPIPWGVRRLKAPEFWPISTGKGVRVGILDTGVNLRHPDLRRNLTDGTNLLNPGEPPEDDNGHGTHVAGIIAAAGDNQGVVGVAPDAVIVPIKAFNTQGESTVSQIVLGIEWALANKVQILNMSFGTGQASLPLLRAIRIAYKQGLIMVAASGNSGRSDQVDFPAGYYGVLGVGAVDYNDTIAEFSRGGYGLDLVAPGVGIRSTYLNEGYTDLSGTSMAAAHISGVAAIILAKEPHLSPNQVFDLLTEAAIQLDGIAASRQGAGIPELTRLL